MTTLEERLADTLHHLALPDTDLAPGVTRALATPATHGSSRGHRLALVAAILVAVLVAATVAIEPARDAVADWLGFGATELEIDPAGRPTGVPRSFAAGEPVEVDVDPIPSLGPPTSAFALASGPGRSFSWAAGPDLPALGTSDVGLVLSVRPVAGDLDRKSLLGGVGAQNVAIDTSDGTVPGLWIDGDHDYLAAGADEVVLAEHVLLWVQDDLQYRLEADLDLAAMTTLAAGVRGGTDLLGAE